MVLYKLNLSRIRNSQNILLLPLMQSKGIQNLRLKLQKGLKNKLRSPTPKPKNLSILQYQIKIIQK